MICRPSHRLAGVWIIAAQAKGDDCHRERKVAQDAKPNDTPFGQWLLLAALSGLKQQVCRLRFVYCFELRPIV